uniref:PLD phosphodiesterase domain-containing protein n=1 Tax=Panagrolaimus sp. ES5 TaxID=591445 RepID=A0AC34F6S7_9BILA
MELGVLVSNCACLTQDLTNIFNNYWHSSNAETPERYYEIQRHQPVALYNMQNPLIIEDSGIITEFYLAASPKTKENPSRTWDLDAVVHEISRSSKYLYIHVMDYFPMFIYSQNKKFWPVIDNALRSAVLRGVDVKIIVSALHYPEISLRFLKSLESLKGINNAATIEVRVFKVPTSSKAQSVLKRERRTHNKFMVTENSAIIGTSNWSGDYFEGKSTGVAAVIKQKFNGKQPFIASMKSIFLRDWNSNYTHNLEKYFLKCVDSYTGDFCEIEKDLSLLVESTKSLS